MAEKKAETETPAKKLPLKTLLILAAVLLIEGLAITGAFMVAGKPASVKADGAAADEVSIKEQPVEELVVSEKFQNSVTGRTYLYDTEIFIVVRRKHQDRVKVKLEEMQARITTEIATIFRRADSKHLEEPTLATITRQVKSSLDELLGRDVASGQPIVDQVLIRRCTKFRADY